MFEYHVPLEGDVTVTRVKHVVIVRHYVAKSLSGEYAVDAIHESFLEEFLDVIASEARTIANRVRRHRRRVLESLHREYAVAEDRGSSKKESSL
jgi:hypothetical protein